MLSKFANKYILKIEGIMKTAYLDDYEKGEMDGTSFQLDYVDGEFTLNGNEGKQELTEIVVNHLRNELHQDNIESNWIMINQNRVTLSMTENADGYPIDDAMAYWASGRDVYACYYDFKISINGKMLEEKDLIELFDFEY